MIKLIKSIDFIENEINENIEEDEKEISINNSQMYNKLLANNKTTFNEIMEFTENSLTQTIKLNDYIIQLNDIIAYGENSIIYKAFKENTDEIYVNILNLLIF